MFHDLDNHFSIELQMVRMTVPQEAEYASLCLIMNDITNHDA